MLQNMEHNNITRVLIYNQPSNQQHNCPKETTTPKHHELLIPNAIQQKLPLMRFLTSTYACYVFLSKIVWCLKFVFRIGGCPNIFWLTWISRRNIFLSNAMSNLTAWVLQNMSNLTSLLILFITTKNKIHVRHVL